MQDRHSCRVAIRVFPPISIDIYDIAFACIMQGTMILLSLKTSETKFNENFICQHCHMQERQGGMWEMA